MNDSTRFGFGENWARYARSVGTAQLEEARDSIRAFLGPHAGRVKGARVLDVGCGSGLFCAAMAGLGAGEIVGIDLDPDSVATSRALVARMAPDARVTVAQVDVLDRAAMAALGSFDLVYAWGSLHHTGALWRAVEHTWGAVAPGGLVWLALYNRTRTSGLWTHAKRAYNHANPLGRLGMTAAWFSARAAVRAVRGKPVFRVERGMDLWHDARDWLGGYPYEAATPAEVHRQLQQRGGVLMAERLTTTLGCNEFLFQRPAA